LIHKASLNPSKIELLAACLPGNPWYRTATGELARVASYRFDDPAGEVGVETFLVRVGAGPTFQVPLTYRGAPLAGAEQWLVGTTEHSVLGTRWVYDACGDPVCAATLARAILADSGQAEQVMEVDGVRKVFPPSMTITSDGVPGAQVPVVERVHRVEPGDPTIIEADGVELAVIRRLGEDRTRNGTMLSGAVLSGARADQPEPVPLAYASVG
jgi:Maltokinase N-terminal cap domain